MEFFFWKMRVFLGKIEFSPENQSSKKKPGIKVILTFVRELVLVYANFQAFVSFFQFKGNDR